VEFSIQGLLENVPTIPIKLSEVKHEEKSTKERRN